MSKPDEVIIYWKNIQFDVILPENKVWPFVLAFGEKFALPPDSSPRQIEGFFPQGFGYCVQAGVHVSEEQKFYNFLRAFCQEHGLPVREDDLRPGQS